MAIRMVTTVTTLRGTLHLIITPIGGPTEGIVRINTIVVVVTGVVEMSATHDTMVVVAGAVMLRPSWEKTLPLAGKAMMIQMTTRQSSGI